MCFRDAIRKRTVHNNNGSSVMTVVEDKDVATDRSTDAATFLNE
jgi:hypothetical protein